MQIPFGRLLMEHVQERCVLLRACWRVAPSPRLQSAFGIPAHVKDKEGTHTSALAPPHTTALAPPQHAAAARPRSPPACPHVSIGLQDCGLPAPPTPLPPLPAQYTTYGRTISIVCDGQVQASSLSHLSHLSSLSPVSAVFSVSAISSASVSASLSPVSASLSPVSGISSASRPTCPLSLCLVSDAGSHQLFEVLIV